jgi:hypothetical protein
MGTPSYPVINTIIVTVVLRRERRRLRSVRRARVPGSITDRAVAVAGLLLRCGRQIVRMIGLDIVVRVCAAEFGGIGFGRSIPIGSIAMTVLGTGGCVGTTTEFAGGGVLGKHVLVGGGVHISVAMEETGEETARSSGSTSSGSCRAGGGVGAVPGGVVVSGTRAEALLFAVVAGEGDFS